MTHVSKPRKPKKPGWLRRTRQWLSHPASEEVLPAIFGDPEPPELKVFDAQVEEIRHEIQEVPGIPTIHDGRSKPTRRH
jgi:hypothetical protein